MTVKYKNQEKHEKISQKEPIQVLWKYNQDNTEFSNFYTKGLKGLEYDILEVKGDRIKTKNHLPSKTEYNTSGEKMEFQ